MANIPECPNLSPNCGYYLSLHSEGTRILRPRQLAIRAYLERLMEFGDVVEVPKQGIDAAHGPLLNVYARAPIEIDSGKGSYLFSTAGTRYHDFGLGIAVNCLGHSHPRLMNRLMTQARKIWHCSNKFNIPPQLECAALLQKATFADKVFFCNSGAEANEGALKIMRRHQFASGKPERWRCITFDGAFHGRTLATLSATGRAAYLQGFGPQAPGFDHATMNDLKSVERLLSDETAGILLEPIQGEGGIRSFDTVFVAELRALTEERGLLLLFDEIQTGVGRSGRFLAGEMYETVPDIASLAKGLGGGFPIGAVLCSQRVAASMVPGTHGTTFGGNPLACAVASEVISEILSPGFLAQVVSNGDHLAARLKSLVAEFPTVLGQQRGVGFMQGPQTICPASVFEAECMARGLIVLAAADNVVRLLPPLNVSLNEIDEATEILEEVCKCL